MTSFGFGFIGLGNMAKAHLNHLRRFPAFRLVAICDMNETSVQTWGDAEGLSVEQRYTQYRDIIADPKVDVIVCVTPNNTHAEIIEACMKAGKPFMAEKPFTRTFEEASALMELYTRNPKPSMIGFSYRYHPQFRYVKQLIDSGKIGRVRHVFIQYLQGWGAASLGRKMAWRFDKNITGTGTLGDLGSHMIDMARYLVGEFEDVAGRLATFVTERVDPTTGQPVPVEVDDFASFHARLAGEVDAVFQTSRNAIGAGNQHEAFIYGDEGTLQVSSNIHDSVQWLYMDEAGQRKQETLSVPEGQGVDQWDEFMKLLQGEVSPMVTTVVDGFRNQAVMEAIIRSHEERRTVLIADLLGADRENAL